MTDIFLANTTLISYDPKTFSNQTPITPTDLKFFDKGVQVQWLNTYGITFLSDFTELIQQNGLDDFLIKLLSQEEHPNKVIELNSLLFVALGVLKIEENVLDTEQLFFVVSANFVWSIQEKHGDYFNWIRERLKLDKGIARKKRADYLLFLIMESIIDNYRVTYERFVDNVDSQLNKPMVVPTPEFTAAVENRKQQLFRIKKAVSSLRDTSVKMEKVTVENIDNKYFGEIKEQTNNLLTDIDFELQEMESKLNLVFSIQGHRLNEVMKTLTLFSVLFIPLTFLAGIYGMNFKNIPELESQYGYFILLGFMVVIAGAIFLYFRRKKWF